MPFSVVFLNLDSVKPQIDLFMETNVNQFSNSDITITYEPRVFINAGRCAKELSDVFRNSVIPWIDLDGAPSQSIITQVQKCPSGALKFHINQKVA
ncbi:(4Fe-4S)-binding protein [Gelidibacter sp. F2691]|nr:(4Fe-4S)-binding protein [Gelidibacter sp. F2691]